MDVVSLLLDHPSFICGYFLRIGSTVVKPCHSIFRSFHDTICHLDFGRFVKDYPVKESHSICRRSLSGDLSSMLLTPIITPINSSTINAICLVSARRDLAQIKSDLHEPFLVYLLPQQNYICRADAVKRRPLTYNQCCYHFSCRSVRLM